jgi:hypothetical protein
MGGLVSTTETSTADRDVNRVANLFPNVSVLKDPVFRIADSLPDIGIRRSAKKVPATAPRQDNRLTSRDCVSPL